MAGTGCFYHVNGKWLTESQFKKVLEDGLLDQLIVNQNFEVPGFNVTVASAYCLAFACNCD